MEIICAHTSVWAVHLLIGACSLASSTKMAWKKGGDIVAFEVVPLSKPQERELSLLCSLLSL